MGSAMRESQILSPQSMFACTLVCTHIHLTFCAPLSPDPSLYYLE